MIKDDFRVEMIGHATLRVRSGGRTLLTDPWLVDPIGHSGFHFPPLVHDPAALAAETDAIYISHVHPDHFNAPTLEHFSRDTPIYIGEYRRKGFRDAIRALGFRVVEVPFQQPTPIAGTEFELAVVEHDFEESAAYDSSAVIRAPAFTLFENNDCVLGAAKYVWVREHFDVDYAFLGYSPASFFPISFELAAEEKARLLAESGETRYRECRDAVALLAPRLTVPFASGLRFLRAEALWKNVAFNSASEMVHRLRARGWAAEVMGPGDRIGADGALRRVCPLLDREAELAAIAAYADRVQDWVTARSPRESVVRPDLVERFRDYLLARWRATRAQLPGVRRHVIAYVLQGAQEQRFYFDFSRSDDQVFQWGEPPRYDMRYTYRSAGLQRRMDGEIDWDELHFTDASVHQIHYAREFYTMLRSETLDLG
ncbi:MAG: MBL fold metallo-hydrolase [Candidatus Binatia bacterium]